uniref:Uncharacterized protein n=1 Tax=Arion vulgaris TaxID=1028688 RepID=A0A0B6ZQY2_9EUPU
MRTQLWIKVVLGWIIFATILQIVGLVAPLWIYLDTSDFTVGVGLFYRIGCEASSGDNCTVTGFPILPFDYNTAATYNQDSWEAIQWLEIIAASFGVILTVLMVVYLVGFGVWKKMNNLNIAMVIVCISAWLPLAIGLIIYIIYYGKVITRSPEVSGRSFPWSPVMCLIAGIIFFIITILIRIRCRNRNFVKNAIPTSTDSKIALNPSTKNQFMKRYFSPSPYREDRRQALYSSVYSSNDTNHLLGNGFTVGAIEHTGIDNTGVVNRNSRAIEYNVVSNVENVPMTHMIQTNNLSAGTFTGNEVVTTGVNTNFTGTIYERDLNSFVNNNTTHYDNNVIETYVTRNLGDSVYAGRIERENVTNYQQDEIEVKRQNYNQSQWTNIPANKEIKYEEERVFRNSTILHHDVGYDDFSEIDAETVYYTGKEGFTPITFNRTQSYNTSDIRNSTTKMDANYNFSTSREFRQPLQPVIEERSIQEVIVTQSDPEKPVVQKHIRLPADHRVINGFQKASDYTVHTRPLTDNLDNDQFILTPGKLSGKRSKYNGSHIYRPYAESSY